MTYRIDTVRNTLAGARELLEMMGDELDDLHVLAYDRPTTAAEAKVKGGSKDYYLDTHGDPKARDAYRTLASAAIDTCNRIEYAINGALKTLREGNTPTATRRGVQLVELGELIAARSRRIQQGEYTPVRRGPQPDEKRAVHELLGKRDATISELRAELDQAKREIDRLRNQQVNRRAS